MSFIKVFSFPLSNIWHPIKSRVSYLLVTLLLISVSPTTFFLNLLLHWHCWRVHGLGHFKIKCTTKAHCSHYKQNLSKAPIEHFALIVITLWMQSVLLGSSLRYPTLYEMFICKIADLRGPSVICTTCLKLLFMAILGPFLPLWPHLVWIIKHQGPTCGTCFACKTFIKSILSGRAFLWKGDLALPLSSCVVPVKSFSVPEAQCPDPWSGDIRS